LKPLAEVIDAHAARMPERPAYHSPGGTLTWAEYARLSDVLASELIGAGLEPGERLAIWLPDGPGVHVAWVAAEKAGLVSVGIGPRAGTQEIRHLITQTGASALLSRSRLRDIDAARIAQALVDTGHPLRLHITADSELPGEAPATPLARVAGRRLGPEDLWLLNSTSGTTGLPKCVGHDQARWNHFHRLAVDAGDLSPDDVFLSALPAPFGFGIWTAHVTPTLLGAPCVLMPRFDAAETIRLIARHRATCLAAVSTQFIMMLNDPTLQRADLSSLRVLFTGGEAVPRERAAEFEERTGAVVLQFYGSNETGALSRTTTRDSRDIRLGTAGHVIEEMDVRLFDDAGRDVTASGRGQPGCRGPLTSRGYYRDAAANERLYTRDGWMLTGDIATIDADGILEVVGRAADFIIRGGKNISGPVVEQQVASHPAVAIAAAVAMPDRVYGERVCVYAELRPGASLDLPELVRHLRERGTSVEYLP
jgi:acyl-CoA synthetase